MNKSINKKECVTTSNIGWKFAGLVSALYMTLGFPADIKAESNNEGQQANITEVIWPSDSTENSKLIDFDTAQKKFEKTFSNVEIDSLMAEYKNEYFQYFDNLPDEEKYEYIHNILRENTEIQRVILKMLEDEDIVEAIRLGDKKAIMEKFNDKMDHEFKYEILGIVYTCLCVAGIYGLKELIKKIW